MSGNLEAATSQLATTASPLPRDRRIAYSVGEVGQMLGLSKSTVLRRVKSGAFPSIRSEGRRLILKDGLAEHLRLVEAG